MRVKTGFVAILPALLLIPLGILASFQLTAIDDIGGRERARLRQTLGTAANGLAQAIEEELFVIPSGFHLGQEELDRHDWTTLKAQFDAWEAYALAPDAIAALALLDAKGGCEVWDGGSFVPATGDTARDLAAREATRAASDIGTGETLPWTLFKVNADLDAILVAAGDADAGLRLAVIVDRRVVADRLVPLLAERHLYGTGEYRFRILDRDDTDRVVYQSDPKAPAEAFDNPDLEASLVLELSSLVEEGNVALVRRDPGQAGKDLFPRTSFSRVLLARRQAQEERGGPANGAVAAEAMTVPEASGEPFAFLAIGSPDRPVERDSPPERRKGLILQAVHREGSLAAAIDASKRRTLALSLGVLGILAAGIVLLSVGMARARRLADRQREFIAAVSHELKTPLAVIRSASENLEDGVVSGEERVRAYGSTLRQESSRLGDLIDRLLRFARLSAGKQGGPPSPVDLREVLAEVAEAYRAEFHAAQFRVELALGDEAAFASVDRAALAVALRNLVENVLRHAASGRFIGLRVHAEPFPAPRGGRDLAGPILGRARKPRAIIRVIDRGPGLSRRERRSVFVPFVRGERARRLQVPGSGIGLGLAQKIVEADGGRLRLVSKPGFGSEFEISYPRVQARPSAPETRPAGDATEAT